MVLECCESGVKVVSEGLLKLYTSDVRVVLRWR
jgi:hypothetical protein